MNAPAFAGMLEEDAAKTIILAFNEAEEFVKAVAK
jgi:glutamate-1-semialdehyde aminotransferase